MSFSAQVKNELARVHARRTCCQSAELAAFVQFDGRSPDGKALEIATGSAAAARKVFVLIKDLLQVTGDVEGARRRLTGRSSYTLRVRAAGEPVKSLAGIGITLEGAGPLAVDAASRNGSVARCCRRAYLRGAFLSRGSMTEPEKDYHLEIVVERDAPARVLCEFMQGFELHAGLAQRKGHAVVYLKDSDDIAAFLGLVGAHSAVLYLENVRIVKGMRNQVNRLVNAETANVDKTVAAALTQLADIELIQGESGLGRLPASLAQVARLRAQFPYASLKELGEMMQPPVSKSGVSYRMRRLSQIARNLRAQRDPGRNLPVPGEEN